MLEDGVRRPILLYFRGSPYGSERHQIMRQLTIYLQHARASQPPNSLALSSSTALVPNNATITHDRDRDRATGSTATGSTATGSTATSSTAAGSTATGSTATGSTATGSTATGSAATHDDDVVLEYTENLGKNALSRSGSMAAQVPCAKG